MNDLAVVVGICATVGGAIWTLAVWMHRASARRISHDVVTERLTEFKRNHDEAARLQEASLSGRLKAAERQLDSGFTELRGQLSGIASDVAGVRASVANIEGRLNGLPKGG